MLEKLRDDVCNDFSESTLPIGKLSIDVSIFSSFSYFSILNLLFLVDFAFSDDLLFSTSYLIMQPKLGKFFDDRLFFRPINLSFSSLFSTIFNGSFFGTKYGLYWRMLFQLIPLKN
jgi:hypothetical protein